MPTQECHNRVNSSPNHQALWKGEWPRLKSRTKSGIESQTRKSVQQPNQVWLQGAIFQLMQFQVANNSTFGETYSQLENFNKPFCQVKSSDIKPSTRRSVLYKDTHRSLKGQIGQRVNKSQRTSVSSLSKHNRMTEKRAYIKFPNVTFNKLLVQLFLVWIGTCCENLQDCNR